ncbi:MAG: metalloregulator ArsR/SmtB family transcription factor [Candidatus Kapabacteria bacterium]|nr:metalloregulator ArsR/SmtB family transcription factor [Candidatus Kapabacteria bacterium]
MEDTKRNITPDKLVRMADVLKTIAHPVRLEIIELLEENGSMGVTELQHKLNIEQSLLSHHLAKMKDRGVLRSKRDGKNLYYSIALKNIETIFDCMGKCKLV